MKKSRIFMATGTLTLAIAAMFATKANKKFATIRTVVFNGNHNVYITNNTGFGSLLTTVNNATASLKTAYGAMFTGTSIKASSTLVTASSTHNILYVK